MGTSRPGVLAAAIRDLLDGASLPDALDRATAELVRWPRHAEVLRALDAARAMAESVDPSPEAVERLGEGWVADEALAIAVFCALGALAASGAGDARGGILPAVNHGGDSDSTGAIAGNLLGAALGEAAPSRLPPSGWRTSRAGRSCCARPTSSTAAPASPRRSRPTSLRLIDRVR